MTPRCCFPALKLNWRCFRPGNSRLACGTIAPQRLRSRRTHSLSPYSSQYGLWATSTTVDTLLDSRREQLGLAESHHVSAQITLKRSSIYKYTSHATPFHEVSRKTRPTTSPPSVACAEFFSARSRRSPLPRSGLNTTTTKKNGKTRNMNAALVHHTHSAGRQLRASTSTACTVR
jgi:hypothetical protein